MVYYAIKNVFRKENQVCRIDFENRVPWFSTVEMVFTGVRGETGAKLQEG